MGKLKMQNMYILRDSVALNKTKDVNSIAIKI